MPPSATRPDIGDGCFRGDSLSQSEAPPYLYSSENNHANIPTQSVPVPVAAPSSHYPSYPFQWNASTLSASVQEQHYGQATGNANAGAGYYQDDRIPAGTDFHGRFSTPRGVIEHGRAYGTTSAPSAAGADPHAYAPAAEAPAPVPSESLRNIARGFLLAPGTHFDAVHITSNAYGRLKVFITLEAADGDSHAYAPTVEAPAPVHSESLSNLARGFLLAPGTHIDAVHITSNGYGRLRVFITLEAADGI
ncbi:hypothetical protein BC827DRAFT_1159497 [Russula dissimulans]|nr:hypothetical protein BC827DRAFT_1159497 [Russula dissimulans]